MLTGLMFSLAQKPVIAANDTSLTAPNEGQELSDGRAFPPAACKPPHGTRRRQSLMRVTQAVSVFLAVIGLTLLALGATDWSFNPNDGLRIHTAVLSFTLPVGVSS